MVQEIDYCIGVKSWHLSHIGIFEGCKTWLDVTLVERDPLCNQLGCQRPGAAIEAGRPLRALGAVEGAPALDDRAIDFLR